MIKTARTYWNGKALKAMAFAVLLSCAFIPPAAAQSEPDITTGLVGHWKLNETSGTGVIDYASNNDGTMQGGMDGSTNSVSGRVQNALDFDGVDDYVQITDAPELSFGDGSSSNPLSICVWANVTDATTSAFAGKCTTGAGNCELSFGTHDDDTLRFNIADSEVTYRIGLLSSMPLTADEGSWHHYCGTYDGGTSNVGIKLYRDGKEMVDTISNDNGSFTAIEDSGTTIDIGAHLRDSGSFNEWMNGALDDVRIYNRVLSATDVNYLYESYDGNLVYDSDTRVPKYFNGENWVAMGESKYIPNAVEFDGVNDYLYGSNEPVADGTSGTVSVWFKADDVSQDRIILQLASGRIMLWYDFSVGQFRIYGENSANAGLFAMRTTTLGLSTDQWHHLLASWDTAGPSPQAHLYIDGLDDRNLEYISADGVIDYTYSDYHVGSGSGFTEQWDGALADLWFEPNVYIDFSIEANRRKFIDENGDPVYLGSNGSAPTGSAPDIFLSGDTVSWHTNKGTSGGFTENGALKDAITKPAMDYIPTNGLVGYWKLDETSGVTAVDYSSSGNNGTWFGSASVASTSGVFGGAFDFENDNSNRVSIGDVSELDLSGANAFTVAAWVKPKGTNGNPVFSRGDFESSANNTGYVFSQYRVDGTRWKAVFSDGTTVASIITAVGTADIGVWQHMMMTWDGTNFRVYKNGANIGSVVPGISLWNPTNSVFREASIGANGRCCDSYFDGSIDDVAVYNRALTPTEISNMYAAGVCANPARINGSIIYNSDSQVIQYCDSLRSSGDGWQAMGPVPGDGTGGCSNPTRAEGSLLFNKDYSVMQYCEGDEWVSVGSWTPPIVPTGCPNIGDTCADGSVYAGLSPDGGMEMYTTPADASSTYSWNDGTSNYTDTSMTNCSDASPGTAATCQTGETNTAYLVGATGEPDYPFAAAEYCDGLSAHGYSDWYLPAQDELNVLYTNKNTGDLNGTFDESLTGNYWSSSEENTSGARAQEFISGSQVRYAKTQSFKIRCVRK